MNNSQLLRYSRQLMLPEVDYAGQERLLAGRVLVIGLGGLGSASAMYLAAAGVGHLVLVDDDVVELSNLQRQIVHGSGSLGQSKVASAAARLRDLNPEVKLTELAERLDSEALRREARAADVVVDGSDNFATRFAVNAACVQARTPLVSGAAIRLEGQLAVFRADLDNRPCYACLYPPADGADARLSCSESGVLAPVVGVIGSLQAVEVIRLLTGFSEADGRRLTLWSALDAVWQTVKFDRDPACPVCGSGSSLPG